MAYIFLLELIVDDLNIFSEPVASCAKDDTISTRGELCVRLQLTNLVRCEVCEKDFGSTLDIEARKTGENCLFAYNSATELAEELVLRISAHGKNLEGAKELLGFWEEPGFEAIDGLARSYDLQNGIRRSNGSKESLGCCYSDQGNRRSKPVSTTFKAMYPLKSEQVDTVVGFAVVTVRLSCLGPNINQKVLFGGRDIQQQPITCYKMGDEPVVKCVTAEDPDTEQRQFVAPNASLATVSEPVADVKEHPPFDEYAAELNGNAICIRVEKDANIAVNIDGDGEAGCTKGCWTSLTLPDGVYGLKEEYVHQQPNACKLPVVRGTLKYPAYHWSGDFMLAKKTTPVTIEDFRRKPDPTRTVGFQAAGPERLEKQLAGIEICRKGWHDPNVDVFVLKLGKNKLSGGSSRNQIEVELRTPKGPTREIRPKETRAVQVLEDEFEPEKTSLQPAAPVPAPTGDGEVKAKKPKPVGKKGKKK